MNSRGVSEVVGYLFIFGIVMTTVTYAFVHISSIVKETSDKYKIEGLRESFKRIQNIFFLSAYGGAPLQSIQIEMQGGKFYMKDNPKITIEVENNSGTYKFFEDNVSSIVFEYGSYKIAIENGAVYESYYDYTRTVVDPRVFIQQVEVQGIPGNYYKVVTLIIYHLKGNGSTSGMGSIELIFSSQVNNSILDENPGNLTFLIENSEFADRWWEYLRNMSQVSVFPSNKPTKGNLVRAIIPYDKLVITIFNVEAKCRELI